MTTTLNIRSEKKHNNYLILNPEEKNFIIFLKFSKKKISKILPKLAVKFFSNFFSQKNVVFSTIDSENKEDI